MWYEEDIKRYTSEIKEFYYNNNIVDHLSIVEKKYEIPNALQIARKFILPFIDKNIYLVLSPFVQGIQMAEFQYIIDQLKKSGRHNIKSNKLPDRELIENAILKIPPYSKSSFMIVPVAFFVEMHRWGMVPTNSHHFIRYEEDRMPYYHFREEKIKIIWSNKFINLNEIIIGSKMDSLWQYKPDKEKDERITIKFETTPEGETLLLKTVFRYTPPPTEYISIIEFPEELAEFK